MLIATWSPGRRAGAGPRGRAPSPNRAPRRPGSRAAPAARTCHTAAPPARTRLYSLIPSKRLYQAPARPPRPARSHHFKLSPGHPDGPTGRRDSHHSLAEPTRSPFAHFLFIVFQLFQRLISTLLQLFFGSKGVETMKNISTLLGVKTFKK